MMEGGISIILLLYGRYVLHLTQWGKVFMAIEIVTMGAPAPCIGRSIRCPSPLGRRHLPDNPPPAQHHHLTNAQI